MSNNAVVFCVKGPHIQLTATAIASILEHYASPQELKILVVVEGASSKDIDYVRALPAIMGRPQVSVDFWAPPAEVQRISPDFSIGVGVPVPPMAVWRLFTPHYFQSYDKLLYLDNDVLLNGDVNDLFDLVNDDYLLAAVPDFMFWAGRFYDPSNYDSESSYHVKHIREYFNNGVMVINNRRYNDEIDVPTLLHMINEGHYHLADQTIINILAEGETRILPFRYNYQHDRQWFEEGHDLDPDLAQKILAEYPHIFIRHFAGTGRLTCPYQHVLSRDEWEDEFWRTFYNVKLLSRR